METESWTVIAPSPVHAEEEEDPDVEADKDPSPSRLQLRPDDRQLYASPVRALAERSLPVGRELVGIDQRRRQSRGSHEFPGTDLPQ